MKKKYSFKYDLYVLQILFVTGKVIIYFLYFTQNCCRKPAVG